MKAVHIYPYSSMKDIPRSDTIYGMIFIAMKMLMGEEFLEDVLQRFIEGNPPFLLSSAFPFTFTDVTKQHWLPRPMLPPFDPFMGASDTERYGKAKAFRAMKYIDSKTFSALASGEKTECELFESWCAGEQGNDAGGCENFLPVETMHNGIHRMSGSVAEGVLFSEREIFFRGGFYFLLRGDETMLNGPLNFLSDFGIGGNNSTGKGQFSYEIGDASFLRVPETASHIVNLSCYLPEEKEIALYRNSDDCYYSISSYRGTLGTHFTGNRRVWKKRLFLFSEGSVFPCNMGKKVYGRMALVKDRDEGLPHPVYFTGYSFPLHFMMKEGTR